VRGLESSQLWCMWQGEHVIVHALLASSGTRSDAAPKIAAATSPVTASAGRVAGVLRDVADQLERGAR
jgi:hypothetical protein